MENPQEEDQLPDWNNMLGNMTHRRKEESGNKLRRNFGMTKPEGEAWLLGDPHRVGTWK
jgi:hypothetical protein